MTDGMSSAGEGKYVYCIIRSGRPREFGSIGIGADASRVYTVHHEDLAAIVSDTPIRIYDPTRENVLAHEFVNETVMRDFTVIPMNFGTIFRTGRGHRRAATLHLSRRSTRCSGRCRTRSSSASRCYGTASGDRCRRERERRDPAPARTRSPRNAESPPTSRACSSAGWWSRRWRRLATVSCAIFTRCCAPRRSPRVPTSPSATDDHERGLSGGSRDQESAFDEGAVNRPQYEDVLTFRYTGPWPPYNFVNIKLKLEKARG